MVPLDGVIFSCALGELMRASGIYFWTAVSYLLIKSGA